MLTTYPLLSRDHEALEAQPWYYLILDEAQQVKNPQARASQVVRSLKTQHRLCLTGTPMENHLGELWAQFDFLLPGFLGDQKRFTQYYRKPIEQEGDQTRLQRLSRRTAPFMLRRTKDHVASELPPRTELLRTTALNAKQATLYESIRLTMEKKVRDAVARKGLARSHITILDALLKLRQVCCDPRLLQSEKHETHGIHSAKLELLLEILPELLDEGRRILLFSQFTTMLGLIQRELEDRGIAFSKLTGQTRKREAAIERFRSGQADVFLISLKAGGVGLNLTEADTVIHYDPLVEPRRGGTGHRSRPSHWPGQARVRIQANHRRHRRGEDPEPAGPQAAPRRQCPRPGSGGGPATPRRRDPAGAAHRGVTSLRPPCPPSVVRRPAGERTTLGSCRAGGTQHPYPGQRNEAHHNATGRLAPQLTRIRGRSIA